MPVTRSRKKAGAQPAEPTYYVISDDDDVLGQPGPAVEEQEPAVDQEEEPDQQSEVDYDRLTKRQAVHLLKQAHEKMAKTQAGILECVDELQKIRDDLYEDYKQGRYSKSAVEQAQAGIKNIEASLTEVVKPAQDE